MPDTFAGLLEQSENLVRLALDKAAAHIDSPSRFPIAASDSIEAALAARLRNLPPALRQRLAAAALPRLEARSTHYGTMAGLDPVDSSSLLKRAVTRAKPVQLVDLPIEPLPLRPPRIVPAQVELHLKDVICRHKTKFEIGQDRVQMAVMAHDVYHRQDNFLAPFTVGKFKNGETIAMNRQVATFPVLDGAVGGMVYPVTIYLAEKDLGGFPKFIKDHKALTDHEMQEVLALALAVSTTALAGLAEGAEIGFSNRGILAAIAIGLLGTVQARPGLKDRQPSIRITGPIRRVLKKILTLVVTDALRSLLKDDVFPPQVAAFFLDMGSPYTAETEPPVVFTIGEAKYEANFEWKVKMGLSREAVAAQTPPTEAATEAQARTNLNKIEHIVVLMLENRSFDHMLGYLSIDRGRSEVDGLRPDLTNRLSGENIDYHPSPLESTAFLKDPAHNNLHIGRQLWGDAFYEEHFKQFENPDDDNRADKVLMPLAPVPDMSGFIDDFRITRFGRGELTPDQLAEVGQIMGYYPAHRVPAFDLLANEFAICNRWFSSFPGNTWVNRTIAATGKPARRLDDQTLIADNDTPLDERAFTRELDERGVDWAWYAQDVPSILAVDATYSNDIGPRKKLRGVPQFFEDLEKNALPKVSWIDPNFVDIGSAGEVLANLIRELNDGRKNTLGQTFLSPDSANDDHPPTDITHGQNLVLEIFLALYSSSAWEKTLFVITYDEHGGFYDHVPPPLLPAGVSEGPAFPWLGMRVPALIVSPFIGRGLVSNRQFDHTSLIRTIFERFCPAAMTDPQTSARVRRADHLGWLLNESRARLLLGATPTESRRNFTARRDAIRAVFRMRIQADLRKNAGVRHPPSELQKQMETLRTSLPKLRERRRARRQPVHAATS